MPGRKHYGTGEKSLILKVHGYFVKEKLRARRDSVTKALERQLDFTKKVYLERHSGTDTEDVAGSRGPRPVVVDDFLRCAIRRKVHSFYAKRQHPTIDNSITYDSHTTWKMFSVQDSGKLQCVVHEGTANSKCNVVGSHIEFRIKISRTTKFYTVM